MAHWVSEVSGHVRGATETNVGFSLPPHLNCHLAWARTHRLQSQATLMLPMTVYANRKSSAYLLSMRRYTCRRPHCPSLFLTLKS